MASTLLYLVPSIPVFFLLLLHISLSVSAQPIHHDASQINLKIAHLESVLEETNKRLKEKDAYLEDCDKRMNELSSKIHHLQSTLSTMKADSLHAETQYKALEEEVQLLWDTLRRNNFDLHILKSKAQDAEERLEEVTSRVEKMGDIVNEQWIQVQHLEQALHVTKVRTLKAQRLTSGTRCTFLKFMNILLDDLRALDSYVFGERAIVSSLISQAMDQLKRCSSLTKKYHHQLQGFIKDLMERNELTASLANDELVFFLKISLKASWEQRVQALTHILTSPTSTPSLHSQFFIGTQIPCYLNWDYPPILCSKPELLKTWLCSFFLKRVLGTAPPQTSWRSKCPFQQPPPFILADGVKEAQWGPQQRRAYVRKRMARKIRNNVNPLIPVAIPNLLLLSLMIWNPFQSQD
ncbi:hypothetical protein CR513_23864, partial [Mucuna pruriens]